MTDTIIKQQAALIQSLTEQVDALSVGKEEFMKTTRPLSKELFSFAKDFQQHLDSQAEFRGLEGKVIKLTTPLTGKKIHGVKDKIMYGKETLIITVGNKEYEKNFGFETKDHIFVEEEEEE